MHTTTHHGVRILLALLLLLTLTSADTMQKRSPLTMGSCAVFGAIAATTLSSNGSTIITGDCGTCAGTMSGLPWGTCTYQEVRTVTACDADSDCNTAYDDGKAKPACTLIASSLGVQTLAPGVYCFSSGSVNLYGNLTLNGASNPDGQWIFQITAGFAIATGSEVVLENGAQACNAYFLMGSSATIGASSKLQGNFLAVRSITVGAGTSNQGTLASLNEAVSLSDNALNAITSCTI